MSTSRTHSTGSGLWATIKKTSDEARTGTSTLADDATLVLALAATTRYILRFKVWYSTATDAMDFKYGLNYTGTTTSVRTHRRASFPGGVSGTDNESTLTEAALPASQALVGTTGSAMVELEVNILTNAAGTLSFQWAQNTSGAGNATVEAGSYLEWAIF